tara:strand:+ start:401 stop:685 length:285 start_codon:yes stop_codon:yes gene_type:complete
MACEKCGYVVCAGVCTPVVNEQENNIEPYYKCPECGSQDISVYLLADYNSTIDSLNLKGDVSWNYSDALTDLYCNECSAEFNDDTAIEVKEEGA